MMKKHRSTKRFQTGQALVEFAISITFLMALAAAAIDLGYIFYVYISLRDAVQEGAVYGAIQPEDCAEIVDRVTDFSDKPVDLNDATHVAVNVAYDYASTPGFDNASCPAVTPDICAGDAIQVTITYSDLPVITPVLGVVMGETIDLDASVTDTILTNPDSTTCP